MLDNQPSRTSKCHIFQLSLQSLNNRLLYFLQEQHRFVFKYWSHGWEIYIGPFPLQRWETTLNLRHHSQRHLLTFFCSQNNLVYLMLCVDVVSTGWGGAAGAHLLATDQQGTTVRRTSRIWGIWCRQISPVILSTSLPHWVLQPSSIHCATSCLFHVKKIGAKSLIMFPYYHCFILERKETV